MMILDGLSVRLAAETNLPLLAWLSYFKSYVSPWYNPFLGRISPLHKPGNG